MVSKAGRGAGNGGREGRRGERGAKNAMTLFAAGSSHVTASEGLVRGSRGFWRFSGVRRTGRGILPGVFYMSEVWVRVVGSSSCIELLHAMGYILQGQLCVHHAARRTPHEVESRWGCLFKKN